MAWAAEGNAAPPGLGASPEVSAGRVGDVPGYTEAVEAAAKAAFEDVHWDDEAYWEDAEESVKVRWRGRAGDWLAAAVPHIERAIRDKIIAELEAEVPESGRQINMTQYREGLVDGVQRAIRRVARDGEATE
jgi:hypothetical protein